MLGKEHSKPKKWQKGNKNRAEIKIENKVEENQQSQKSILEKTSKNRQTFDKAV